MKNFTRVFVLLFFVAYFSPTFAATDPEEEVNKKRYYALLVAIDEYKGTEWSQLKTPINDANKIKDVLLGKYGFEEVITIYDEQATRANIINKIDKLAQNVTENDNIFIYFSGHGVEIGNEGYWVPADALTNERSQLIPNSEIKTALAKTVSQHALIMVDACFSSTIFKSSQVSIQNDGSVDYYNQIDALMSRQAITAGGLEPVLDGSGEHSTFAKYLIKYLKKNKKENLDASELYEMLKYPVQANSPNVPRFGHIQNTGHEGGQFIFKLSKNTDKSCNFSGVKIKEGAKVIFPHDGGMLHALVDEYDKKIYYEWVKGSSSLTTKGKDLKITESGTYSVIVTTDDECSDAAVVEVIVALPDVEVQIQEGSDVSFTNEGTLHAILSNVGEDVIYEWSKNNYIIGQEPNLDVVEAGTYEVTIRLKDGRKIATSKTVVSIKDRTYSIRIGDNMARIARKFYGDVSKEDYLYEVNSGIVQKGELLRVGTEIKIPVLDKKVTEDVVPNSTANRLHIAANEDMPPFSQIGLFNNGMITDIVKTVIKEGGEVPVVDFMSGNKMRAQTFSGKTTAAFPCVYNEDEAKFFYFSKPLYKELTVIFISMEAPLDKNGKPKKIAYNKERDLTGNRIAVVRGFVSEKLLKLKKERKIGLLAYNTWEECFEKLKEGKVDMVAAPQAVGILTTQNSRNVSSKDFKMLSKTFEETSFHLVVSKQRPDGKAVIEKFNKTLTKMNKDGSIGKIQNMHIDIFQKENP